MLYREPGRPLTGVESNAVEGRPTLPTRALKHGEPRRPRDAVEKVCLCCRRPFTAEHRLIFRCEPCRAAPENRWVR